MPAAVFLGKPSSGFLCCYIVLTQVVITLVVAGISVSINRLSHENGFQKKGRIIVLSVFLTAIMLVEIGIVNHIVLLTVRSIKQIQQERKLKEFIVEQALVKKETVQIPSIYVVVK